MSWSTVSNAADRSSTDRSRHHLYIQNVRQYFEHGRLGRLQARPQTGSGRAAGKRYAREAWTAAIAINWKSACETMDRQS